MSRDPLLYLGDIVAACRKIERLAAAVEDDGLLADETLRDAILFNIVIIGEAASRTPPDVQEKWPSVPWARIKAMRNIVAHEYFGLDRGIILDVVRNKVPVLLRTLEPAAGSD